mmetsp:Transcript_78439/g.197036  ORF Transcript_78439/g.197036 Transcript_78439/m.197036 type:complete len:304 (+) Transcript_78439:303-1214(+)
MAAANSGSFTGLPSRRSLSSIIIKDEGLFERSKCLPIFPMSPSGSSRLSKTSPSFTAACASSLYFLANSWTLLSNADMPRNWPMRMSLSFIISKPEGFLAPSRPTQRACMSASNVALRFFISSSRALVARSSRPWYSANSAISGAMPACFCCSYSAATCWNLNCASASLSICMLEAPGMPPGGGMLPPPGIPLACMLGPSLEVPGTTGNGGSACGLPGSPGIGGMPGIPGGAPGRWGIEGIPGMTGGIPGRPPPCWPPGSGMGGMAEKSAMPGMSKPPSAGKVCWSPASPAALLRPIAMPGGS